MSAVEASDIVSAFNLATRLNRAAEDGTVLEVLMPNGKPFRKCSGEEIGRFGLWLKEVGDEVGCMKEGA